MTIRDVVFRDIKTTTVTQMRDVHIRDKIIKDCILLGSPLTAGMFSSRIVSCLHPWFCGLCGSLELVDLVDLVDL